MANNLSMIIVPKQCALNIMNLLPKAGGDFRTVCTLSTYMRIETRLQAKEEKEWNTNHADDEDTAKPGTSCLTGMEERLVDIEILKTQGRDVL